MCLCVSGRKKIDDYSEKTHDWPLFERLMLSAWIRLFEPENKIALEVAGQWAYIAERSFRSGRYNKNDDAEAFYEQFGRKPKSRFETGFGMFYHVALLQGVLNPATEKLLLDYYISGAQGIYYVYEKCPGKLPEIFSSRETSPGYMTAEPLSYILPWLLNGGTYVRGDGTETVDLFPLLRQHIFSAYCQRLPESSVS